MQCPDAVPKLPCLGYVRSFHEEADGLDYEPRGVTFYGPGEILPEAISIAPVPQSPILEAAAAVVEARANRCNRELSPFLKQRSMEGRLPRQTARTMRRRVLFASNVGASSLFSLLLHDTLNAGVEETMAKALRIIQ